MPYTIESDHQHKIVRNTYSGIISRDDLAGVWRQYLSLKEFTELKYNLLSDYRNSNFDVSLEDRKPMFQFLVSIKHILNGKKEAVILRDPKDTAMSILLQRDVLNVYKELGYNVELFSSEEAAIEWLSIP